MSASSSPSAPYAEKFADLRTEAVASLQAAKAHRASLREVISNRRAEIEQLEQLDASAEEAEDGFITTLAKIERWSRGDFNDLE